MPDNDTNLPIEQPRDEQGQFVSPTPDAAPAGESAASSADATPIAAAASVAPEVDRDAIEADAYAKVLEKHGIERSPRTDSPQTDSAPQATDHPAEGTAPQSQGTPAAGTPPAVGTKADPRQSAKLEDYNGIDDRAFNDLKRVGLLIPPAAWNAMDVDQRAKTIGAARDIKARQDRAYQLEQQARTQQTNAPPAGQQPAATQTNPTEAGRDFGQPNAGAMRPAEVAQTTPASQQAPAATGQPAPITLAPEIEAQLQAVRETYGDELANAQRAIAEASARQVEAMRQQFQQQQQQLFTSVAEQRRDEQLKQVAAAEAKALADLAKDFPQLADPDKAAEIKAKAMAYAIAMAAQGTRYTDIDKAVRDSLTFVAQAEFYPEIQTQKRTKLAEQRKRSLAGSVERGTATVETGRTKGPRDIEAEAFRLLQAEHARGIKGESAISTVAQKLR